MLINILNLAYKPASFCPNSRLFIMKKEEILPVWKELNEQLFRFVHSKTKDKELSKDIASSLIRELVAFLSSIPA